MRRQTLSAAFLGHSAALYVPFMQPIKKAFCGGCIKKTLPRQHFGRRSAGGRGGTPSQVLQRVRWYNLLHHTHKLGNFSLLGAGMAYLQRVPFRDSDICPFTGVGKFGGSLFMVADNAGFSFLWCAKTLFMTSQNCKTLRSQIFGNQKMTCGANEKPCPVP